MRIGPGALVMVMLGACAPATTDERATPPFAQSTVATAVASVDAAAAAPSASVQASASAAPIERPARRRAGPGRIGCGPKDCVAGKEMCCAPSWNHEPFFACTSRPRVFPPLDTPANSGGSAEKDIEPIETPCKKALSVEESLIGGLFLACDDSGDCPKGTGCCGSGWYGVARFGTACVPLAADGSLPCMEYEVCANDGDKCADSKLVCEDGHCVKPDRAVSCGSAVCRGTTPVCCGQPGSMRCSARADCGGDAMTPIARCSSAQDCGKGQVCCGDQIGSAQCVGFCEWGEGATVLCKTTAECRGAGPKGRCVVEAGVGHCEFL